MNYYTVQILYYCIKKYWITNIFQFLAIFTQNWDYFTQKYHIYD